METPGVITPQAMRGPDVRERQEARWCQKSGLISVRLLVEVSNMVALARRS